MQKEALTNAQDKRYNPQQVQNLGPAGPMSVEMNLNQPMLNYSTGNLLRKRQAGPGRIASLATSTLLPLALLLLVSGCQTPPQQKVTSLPETSGNGAGMVASRSSGTTNSNLIVLREGDSVRVSFPGAENLNRVVLIRRDGRVTLPLIGDFEAAGLTPPEMERQLLQLYSPQLQTKEVSVAVESSAFPVYVTGAVLRPGKILSDRPLTALEAIMEAGGFDYSKANLKSVQVIRNRSSRTDHYVLN